MKIKICLLIIFLSLVFNTSVFAEDDWQYWSAYSFNYKISDKVDFVFNPAFRLKDEISEYQYWESRQGLLFKINKNWDVNLHYLHGESKNSANKWIDENRLELQPTYKWSWGKFKFSDRFRLEYRIVNGTEKWRYRNKIRLSKTLTIFDYEITSFVDEEIFYDEYVDQYNQNRASLGFSKKISDKISASIFYMYKSDKKGGDWQGANVIGTTLKFSL